MSNNNNKEIKVEKTPTKKVTISDQIRKLFKEGKTTKEISDILGKRYQHVNNVLTRDREKRELEQLRSEKVKTETK